MRITKVIWLPSVVEKLTWKHHLTTDEVEQAFKNQPRFRFSGRGKHKGEDVYVAFAQR